MKRLTIYRNFAILHIQTHESRIKLPYPIQMLDIHCSHSYHLQDHWLEVQHTSTTSLSKCYHEDIVELDEEDLSSVQSINKSSNEETVEIIIKMENIKWLTQYILFRDQGILICKALINNSGCDLQVDHMSLVYRNTDFHPKTGILQLNHTTNITSDDATFVKGNIDVIDLSTKSIGTQLCVELWKEKIKVKEIYEIDIQNRDQIFTNNFLVFHAPRNLLPGHFEIYDQTDVLVSLGSLDIKKYNQGNKIMIQFPQTKDIVCKNERIHTYHSFFTERSELTFSSKIKNPFLRKIILRYYIVTNEYKDASIPPSSKKDKWVFWDVELKEKSQEFKVVIQLNG
jgi:hypothetical protein